MAKNFPGGRLRSHHLLGLVGLLSCAGACNRAEPEKSFPLDTTQGQASSENTASSPGAGSGLVLPGSSDASSSQATLHRPAGSGVDDSTVAAVATSRQPVDSQGSSATSAPSSAATSGGSSTPPATVASTKTPEQQGVHIEFAEPGFPSTGLESPTAGGSDVAERLSDRAFMNLKMPESSAPSVLLTFFNECDRAVQDLAMTKRAEQLSEAEFRDQARRLSALKLAGAERLLSLPGLKPEEQKSGTAALVESLSHLTSLGDVAAAKKLQALAEELAKSSDIELAHQGKLVLLGFRLNQLQEGQLKNPQILLSDIDQLFVVDHGRGLVEMMALQRCAEVLAQLGYDVETKQVLQRIVDQYRSSPDINLSMRAWSIETDGAPTLIAFHESLKATFEGDGKNSTLVADSARSLLQAYAGINTLLHVSRFMIPLEFSGNVQAASELARVVAEARRPLTSAALTTEIDTFLECHARRLGCVGKPIALSELVSFDGKPFDWSSYRGKVVLVCFWASWEINSLEELRRLKELRQQIKSTDFEIVAINCDDTNMANAEQMISHQAYPWHNVRSSNPAAVGFATPAAKTLGVNAVPFLMLVDKKGNVAAIHVRGPKSIDLINELLGESK